jgi:hypothetical protein
MDGLIYRPRLTPALSPPSLSVILQGHLQQMQMVLLPMVLLPMEYGPSPAPLGS